MAETIGGHAVKTTAKRVVKSSKFSRAKAAAVDVAKRVPVGGVLGPFVSAAQQVISKMPSESQLKAAKRARTRADAAVKDVEKRMKLTKKQRNVLLQQHIDYFRRNP